MEAILQAIRKNTFVIIYSQWCGYSRNALQLLKDEKDITRIEIEKTGLSLQEIIQSLEFANVGMRNGYKTRPLVFYKGKFLGGYNDLVNFRQ